MKAYTKSSHLKAHKRVHTGILYHVHCVCIVCTNVFFYSLFIRPNIFYLFYHFTFITIYLHFTIYLQERNRFLVHLQTANGVLHAQTNWQGTSESTRVQNLSCVRTAAARSPERITWPLISDATAGPGKAWARNREVPLVTTPWLDQSEHLILVL